MLFLPAGLPSSRASSRGFASAGGGAVTVAVAEDVDRGGPSVVAALMAREASTPATVQAERAATAVIFSVFSDMVLSTPLASEATATGTTPAIATGLAANRAEARAMAS